MAKTSSETQREEEPGCPQGVSGRHVVRGTTVLTYPRSAPRGTGKAGENGQTSGEVGGSSAWTRPSAPECGDTLKAPAGRPASDLEWRSSSKTAPGSLSTGSPAGRTPPHGDGSMYSQANVRVESVLRPPPERCRPWSWTLKRCCGKRMGPVKLVEVRPHTDGKVFAPGCASKPDCESREEPEEHKRKQRRRALQFILASLMDICHLKNAELEAKHQKYKGRVVLRGEIVKDDSGSYAVFTEQGSSASQMTAARIMDIISRLPGCDGQAADAVSAYTQVKMEDAHKLLKIPKSECPDIWIRLPRHKWPKSWSSMEDPVVPLERNLYGHPLAGLLWERQFEKILLKHGWEKIPNWECLFVHREKGLFLSVYVDDIKLAGKKQKSWSDVETTQ